MEKSLKFNSQVCPRPAVCIFNEGSQYFAADEEKAIRRACRQAEEFMQSYGQGEQPQPLIAPAHIGDYIDYRIINPLTQTNRQQWKESDLHPRR